MVEEYFSAKRRWLSRQLEVSYMQGTKDMSDIIRGKIIALDEVLDTKNVFKRYDELKEKVAKQQKGAN